MSGACPLHLDVKNSFVLAYNALTQFIFFSLGETRCEDWKFERLWLCSFY